MPNKCKKCENEDNYNYAINNGLCNTCIEGQLEQLKAELGQWKEQANTAAVNALERLGECETHQSTIGVLSGKVLGLQAENERLKSRKGCCDDCFVVTESEKENKQLRADLDRARHYTGLEGYPCPLCTYKDGVFVESCEMHRHGQAK